MSRPLHRPVLAGAALAVALLLVGCGASGGSNGPSGGSSGAGAVASQSSPAAGTNGLESLSADEIVAKVKAAVAAASSVRVKGSQGDATIDLAMGQDQASATVRKTGEAVLVEYTGGVYYIKGDKAFWTKEAGGTAAAMLADKYVKVGAAQATPFKGFLSLKSFANESVKPSGTVTKGQVTEVDGTPALGLVDADGTLFVSLQGTPYPLKVQNAKGANSGVLTFSDWNQPVTVSVPPAAQVVDLAKLTGG